MSKLAEIWRRIIHLGQRTEFERGLSEEMRHHLELMTEQFKRDGMPEKDAHHAARREFGNQTLLQEESRRLWGWRAIEDLFRDMRYAGRGLRMNPSFTLVAVFVLALGIGANAAFFSILDAMMFRAPSGVGEPVQLKRVYFSGTLPKFGSAASTTTSFPTFMDLRDATHSFDSVAAYWPITSDFGRGPQAQSIHVSYVSGNYFTVLGVHPPVAGRLFTAREDIFANAGVAVISNSFWRSAFGSDSGIVGKQAWIAGTSRIIVGVAPEGFDGPDMVAQQAWLPISAPPESFPGPQGLTNRSYVWVRILARLRRNVTVSHAQSDSTAAYRVGARATDKNVDRMNVVLAPLPAGRSPRMSDSVRLSLWLFGVSGVLLLIVAANIVNLFLVRSLQSRGEMAVRQVMGASRTQLVRQALVEYTTITALGGIAAAFVAAWAGSLVRTFLLKGTVFAETGIDLRAVRFLALVTIVTGVLSSIFPAIQSGRTETVAALRSGTQRGWTHRSYVRNALLVAQVGLAFVLMMGSGLFVRTYRNLTTLDLGMKTDHVLFATMDLQSVGMKHNAVNAQYEAMRDRVLSIPGVESAATAIAVPFYSQYGTLITVPGHSELPKMNGPDIKPVSTNYFATLGLTLLRGRGFTDADTNGAPRVTVVNETMAKAVWPNEDALGQCINVGENHDCTQVIGIVADPRQEEIIEDPSMQYFVPLAQLDGATMPVPIHALFVRTSVSPESLISTIRQAMQSSAPSLPYANVRLFSSLYESQLEPSRIGASMFTVFGGLSMFVAAIGLYGLVAFSVKLQTHEIGVRMALGAQHMDVARMVLVNGLRFVLAGAVLGIAGALAGARLLSHLLYGVKPTDPLTYVLVFSLEIVVAAVACYIPARRAMTVDPHVALRFD